MSLPEVRGVLDRGRTTAEEFIGVQTTVSDTMRTIGSVASASSESVRQLSLQLSQVEQSLGEVTISEKRAGADMDDVIGSLLMASVGTRGLDTAAQSYREAAGANEEVITRLELLKGRLPEYLQKLADLQQFLDGIVSTTVGLEMTASGAAQASRVAIAETDSYISGL